MANMAKIVSPVWSSARGSICGITYLTTSSGQIIARQRTRPVETPSNFRTWIKSAMQQRAAHWNSLSALQRANWDLFAIVNGFQTGRLAYLAGTVFMQFVTNTGLAGAVTGLRDDAPDTNNFPQCSISTTTPVIANNDSVAVKITNSGPQRVMQYIEVSPGFNAARNFYKGPWDTSRSFAGTLASGVSALVEFHGLNPGERYFIKARIATDDVTVGLRGNTLQAAMYTNSIAIHVP
jgi:hypothetical protein